MDSIHDFVQPVPLEMPPAREVVHEINLIDPDYKPTYHQPRCPDALRGELADKIDRYTKVGWWRPASVQSAAPMICVYKKDRHLHTVIDGRKRNENTIKDVTPFPDQDNIRNNVARAKFRTKLDMSDAYEQIHVKESDVMKTAFATIIGTYVSYVMQQGDCNAPSTFQRFMIYVFRNEVGRFIFVYLDDIFIYSKTLEDHEKHLAIVFDILRKEKLYLSAKKVDLYSTRMDCLGHIIDDDGIHADADKMHKLRDWRTPRDYHDVQRFLGLVQYLAQFMPNLTAYTTPLSGMARHNMPFVWTAVHDKCFESIKALICKMPILRPIDPDDPNTIWVVCDASARGVGAFYGQGTEWHKARPAGFLSKKFTPAQCSYHTWEQELIAILEALTRWEDKLIGRIITIVTNHKALTFFRTKHHMSDRQVRWWEFLSRFQYNLVYTKGSSNKIADALSRYYMNDKPDEIQHTDDYVNIDARIDPHCEYLTDLRRHEMQRGFPEAASSNIVRRSARNVRPRQDADTTSASNHGGVVDNKSTRQPLRPKSRSKIAEDLTALVAAVSAINLQHRVESASNIVAHIQGGYNADPMFARVTAALPQHVHYWIKNGILYTKSRNGIAVVCVPNVKFDKRRIVEVIIDEAHRAIGHLGPDKTLSYVRRWYC